MIYSGMAPLAVLWLSPGPSYNQKENGADDGGFFDRRLRDAGKPGTEISRPNRPRFKNPSGQGYLADAPLPNNSAIERRKSSNVKGLFRITLTGFSAFLSFSA